MDPTTFDRWTRQFPRRTGRRQALFALLGAAAALGVVPAESRKRKKKKKTCKPPQIRCGKACCQAGVPCVNGACGCSAGQVFCNLGGSLGSGCFSGDCCLANCTGDTCCPAGAVCAPNPAQPPGAANCLCTAGVRCGKTCCEPGQACNNGGCGACQAGSDAACGVTCDCLTSVDNITACTNKTSLLLCSSCTTSAQCGTGQLCIALPTSSPCTQQRACIAIGCR